MPSNFPVSKSFVLFSLPFFFSVWMVSACDIFSFVCLLQSNARFVLRCQNLFFCSSCFHCFQHTPCYSSDPKHTISYKKWTLNFLASFITSLPVGGRFEPCWRTGPWCRYENREDRKRVDSARTTADGRYPSWSLGARSGVTPALWTIVRFCYKIF